MRVTGRATVQRPGHACIAGHNNGTVARPGVRTRPPSRPRPGAPALRHPAGRRLPSVSAGGSSPAWQSRSPGRAGRSPAGDATRSDEYLLVDRRYWTGAYLCPDAGRDIGTAFRAHWLRVLVVIALDSQTASSSLRPAAPSRGTDPAAPDTDGRILDSSGLGGEMQLVGTPEATAPTPHHCCCFDDRCPGTPPYGRRFGSRGDA
jgi:hypothetical protein